MRYKSSIFLVLNEECKDVWNYFSMLMRYEEIMEHEILIGYEAKKRSFADAMKNRYDRCENMKWIEVRNAEKKGSCYNLMTLYAHSDVYFFLDMGILLGNHCLEYLLESLEKEEDALTVQPLEIQFHAFLAQSTGEIFSNQRAGSALLGIHRLVFESLEGFRETLPNREIRKEIMIRIRETGYQNYYNPHAKVYDTSDYKREKDELILAEVLQEVSDFLLKANLDFQL